MPATPVIMEELVTRASLATPARVTMDGRGLSVTQVIALVLQSRYFIDGFMLSKH